MPDLKEVHQRLLEKRRERREITKSFKDELAHDAEYQEILDELKTLKERKKSIEDRVRAAASADATKLDTLGLEIRAETELLADLAINSYMDGRSATFEDTNGQRWVPNFSVRFTKDEGRTANVRAEEERASAPAEDAPAPAPADERSEERELAPA